DGGEALPVRREVRQEVALQGEAPASRRVDQGACSHAGDVGARPRQPRATPATPRGGHAGRGGRGQGNPAGLAKGGRRGGRTRRDSRYSTPGESTPARTA